MVRRVLRRGAVAAACASVAVGAVPVPGAGAPAGAAAGQVTIAISAPAPAPASTGDELVIEASIANGTDVEQLVTVERTGALVVGPGEPVSYELLSIGRGTPCPSASCTFRIVPGGSLPIRGRYAVAEPGSITIELTASVDDAPVASAEVSATVDGPACTVRGTPGPDQLTASDPAGDVVCGFESGDVLVPGPGPDVLLGSTGGDTVDLRSAPVAPADAGKGWIVDLGRGTPGSAVIVGAAPASADVLDDVQDVIGSAGADRIRGSGGMNVLDGGPGDDRIDAGAGNDILIGGRGNDILIGGPGIDRASYLPHTRGVRVSLLTNAPQQTGGAGVDILSTTVEGLQGTSLADVLVGDAGPNTILGWGGADRIFGGAGDDWLTGQFAAIAFDGGAGTDTCRVYAGSTTARTGCERG